MLPFDDEGHNWCYNIDSIQASSYGNKIYFKVFSRPEIYMYDIEKYKLDRFHFQNKSYIPKHVGMKFVGDYMLLIGSKIMWEYDMNHLNLGDI